MIMFALYGTLVICAFIWSALLVHLYMRWRNRKYGRRSWL